MDADGWLVSSCQGGWASNLNVSMRSSGSGQDWKHASKVLDAFRTIPGTFPELEPQSSGDVCRIFTVLDPARPNRHKHDAIISITIGTKTQPILTREMLEPDD